MHIQLNKLTYIWVFIVFLTKAYFNHSAPQDLLVAGVWCYKVLFKRVDFEFDDFFERAWSIMAVALGAKQASKQASKQADLLASKTMHNDNYQIIQILCDAKWRGW